MEILFLMKINQIKIHKSLDEDSFLFCIKKWLFVHSEFFEITNSMTFSHVCNIPAKVHTVNQVFLGINIHAKVSDTNPTNQNLLPELLPHLD